MINKRTKCRASWHRIHDLGWGGKRIFPRKKLQIHLGARWWRVLKGLPWKSDFIIREIGS